MLFAKFIYAHTYVSSRESFITMMTLNPHEFIKRIKTVNCNYMNIYQKKS